MHHDDYPNEWAVIANKGYQGLQEIHQAIIPIKRRPRQVLSASDDAFNRQVSSDRIIIENYFGRLSSLWAFFSVKWRRSLNFYEDFFQVPAALTDFNITSHPLRARNGDKYVQFRNRLVHIANESTESRSGLRIVHKFASLN